MKIKIEALPEEKITTSIKPINREDATLEAEKGEIVYDPNKLTLNKVLGKRHAQGGTPLNLPEGNFLFSDYNKLSIKPKDRELMQFKTGGTKRLTPAKLLEKEIDIKHHNTMINILQKGKGDEITQNSANLMLSKNLETIGKTAFLQESKKKFPDGIPSFSQGSAPIFSDETFKEMNQAKQYKSGGLLPKFQSAGFWDILKKYGYVQPKKGEYYNPKNVPGYNDPTYIGAVVDWLNYYNPWNAGTGQQALSKIREEQSKKYPWTVDAAADLDFFNYNKTYDKGYVDKGRNYYDAYAIKTPRILSSLDELKDVVKNENWIKLDPFKYGPNRYYKKDPDSGGRAVFTELKYSPEKISSKTNNLINGQIRPRILYSNNPSSSSSPHSKEEEEDLPLQGTDYNVGLTGWEKLNAAYPFFKAATVKTLWPLRQHQESLISNPEYASARPYLNRIDQSYFNTAQLARINPNASQSIQQLQGDRIDQSNQAIANVEEQNRQTGSQFRTNIANVLNQDASANRQHDLSYYDRAQTSIQNRDDMKDYLFNQGLTNLNDMIAQNQSFNYLLNSQPQIGTNEWIDRYGRPTNDRSKAVARRARTITEFIPGFFGNRLYNPTTFNVKDLLSYNTGLSGSNYNFIQNEIDRLDKLREQASPEERKGLDYRIGRLYSSLFRGNS